MGLYGLLLAGWCAVMIVMTDSPVGLRVRTILLFVLVAVVAYRILRETNKLPEGATGVIIGGLVGLISGGAVASMVRFLGPSSILPATLVVLAFAGLGWLISSFRRASAVIDQTTAELAVAERTASSPVTSLSDHADAHPDRQPPQQ